MNFSQFLLLESARFPYALRFMAITTNIPPQAYTRDVLVKAIEWMSHQPQAVRERANSADLIVSFYLQARRRMSAAQAEAPVSGETFKQDLKHLAKDLKQFEEPSAPPSSSPSRSLSHGDFDLPDPMPLQTHNHLHTAPAQQQHVHLHVQHAPVTATAQVATQVHVTPQSDPSGGRGMSWTVDAKSLAFARELQERFNLSSESEALRMLITLGIEKARDLFP